MIGRFFPGCIKKLPITMDCCWTPLEMIMKLNYKLNEIIDYLDNNTPATEQWVTQQIEVALSNSKTYTDDQIKMVRSDFEELQKTVIMYMSDTDKKIDDFMTEQERNYIAFVASISAKIVAITNIVENNNNYIKEWVKNELSKFMDEIRHKTPIVINPTTGGLDSLQNTLNDIWDKLRYFGLTAQEYDDLELSADEYASKNLTATQYDLWGRKYLTINHDLYMFNPFTGEYDKIIDVVYKLSTFHLEEPLTAAEYDALNITAEVYDAKAITAWEYDNKGKALLAA